MNKEQLDKKVEAFKRELITCIRERLKDKCSTKEYITLITPYERYYAICYTSEDIILVGNRKISDTEVETHAEQFDINSLIEILKQLYDGH